MVSCDLAFVVAVGSWVVVALAVALVVGKAARLGASDNENIEDERDHA